MPTYDYKCNDCDHTFEHFQSMTSDTLTVCPECQGELRRLIGAGAGFLFKGSGFYITDYRSGEYTRKAESEGKKSDGKKSEGKKDDAKKSEGPAISAKDSGSSGAGASESKAGGAPKGGAGGSAE